MVPHITNEIIEQIKERQAQRLREEEQRDQERAFILKQIDAMRDEEVEQQKSKRVAAAKLMEEVAVATAIAVAGPRALWPVG